MWLVDFDLDSGPVVDAVVPPLFLLPSESNNMCVCFFKRWFHGRRTEKSVNTSRAFAAFPDSPQFDQGTQCHSFRIRERLSSTYDSKRPATNDGYIYGFSHFTQKRDETSKRGYQQVSPLCLCHKPALIDDFFCAALGRCSYPTSISGALHIHSVCFRTIIPRAWRTHVRGSMPQYCDLVWFSVEFCPTHRANHAKDRPAPKPGETLELGFLGTVIHVEIPHTIDQFQLTETSSFNEKYDPNLHVRSPPSPFLARNFWYCLLRFWLLVHLFTLRHCFYLRHAYRTSGQFGNAWYYVSLSSCLGNLLHKRVRRSGGCETSCVR